MSYNRERLIRLFRAMEPPPSSIVNALLEYALNGDVGELYLRVSALEALVGYGDVLPPETILSAFDSLQSGIESNRLVDLLERLNGIRSNFDASYAGGFVSLESAGRGEADGSKLPEVQHPDSPTDAPSIQAASSEEADELAASAEAAPSAEPQGPGRSGSIFLISIGAVTFLLALAGYRVFSKKGRSGS